MTIIINQNSGGVVPFGKYKDHPVETLLGDDGYVRWLMEQGWVRDRYPQLFQLIINQGGQDCETPEHNALQAKFLKDDYCQKFAVSLLRCTRRDVATKDAYIEHIKHGIADTFREMAATGAPHRYTIVIERVEQHVCIRREDRYNPRATYLRGVSLGAIQSATVLSFEHEKGADVSIRLSGVINLDILVEAKPTVGDDYPRVLRQIKRQGASCTVIGSFQSQAIDIVDLRKIFLMDRVAVLIDSEIEAVNLSDEQLVINGEDIAGVARFVGNHANAFKCSVKSNL